MDFKKILKSIKLHESTISMVLGALVIVAAGALLINLFARRQGETIPPVEIEDEATLPTKHIVAAGESLWTISEKYYGTGYNWVDIALENDLQDANDIAQGQELSIPAVAPRVVAENATLSPTPQPTKIAEKSPTPTPLPTKQKGVHKVAKGESLWNIAEEYYKSGYNWVDIAKENKLANPGAIDVDQELVIPEVEAKQATASEPEKVSETQPITGATYLVQKNDNLWNIALRAYGDGYRWADIAKENNLKNPHIIHPGNTLTLPR